MLPRLAGIMATLRESIEHASLPAVRRLSELPRIVPFLIVLALMVLGIVVKPWGWVFIALVGVFLSWMLYLGWPRLSTPEKFMRLAVLVLVFGATLTRAVPMG